MKLLCAALLAIMAVACAKPKVCPEPVVINEYELLGKYVKDWVCFEAEGKCAKVLIKNLDKE